MIRVRTDDVLVTSEPMKGREFDKWKKHHLWCMEMPHIFYHTPAILCSEIQNFPEAITYIKAELDDGKLFPDLHGWEHINYTKLTQNQIEEHLEKSFEFFLKHFDCLPLRWATPWGADSPEIRQACKKFSLEWEGVTGHVIDQTPAMSKVKKTGYIDCLKDRTVMVHWFERGLKLYRIVLTAKYGSWDKAAEKFPEYFEKE